MIKESYEKATERKLDKSDTEKAQVRDRNKRKRMFLRLYGSKGKAKQNSATFKLNTINVIK